MDRAAAYFDLGGTIRTSTALETLEWLKPVFPKVGLTRIARVTGLDHVGIAVSVSVRPHARTLTVSQGKGLTAELADASAAMESIELWHAENVRPAELEASFAGLSPRDPVLDPLELPEGPMPFLLDLRVQQTGWLPARDLIADRVVYVPRWCCTLGNDRPNLQRLARKVSSTGLAGGNSIDEATVHALCEVIERDATERFDALSENERDARQIALGTVGGPAGTLLSQIERAGLSVRLWDQQGPVAVPTFGCLLDDAGHVRGLGAFGGHGTHLSAQVALCRAITEAVQSRLTIIAGTRDDRSPASYARSRVALGVPRFPAAPGRGFSESNGLTGSFAGDLASLLQRVQSAGFGSVLRVNLEHEAIGVPVVKVIVPRAREGIH